MAKINRYTDIRPSQYSPMSLQELMMVPAYKRTQHDQLLEASAGLETELAKVDPLLYHSDIARQEQERIRKQIEDQVNLLNEEGFTNNSKQRLLDINRDYQKSISPTGIIGKINNAKQVLEANRKAHIDESIKLGNSTEDAVRNWMEFEKQYIDEFNRTGQITPIGQLGAPEYIDYIKEANDIFKEVGYTEEEIANGALSQIVFDPELGSYVKTTGGSSNRVKTNNAQLEKALNILNSQLRDPNSKIRQSLEYTNTDPNRVLSELTDLANSQLINETEKKYGSSTITNFKPVIKDDVDRIPNFFNDQIRGVDTSNISKESPLFNNYKFENSDFDTNGNIKVNTGNYPTYEDKVNAFKNQPNYSNIRFNKDSGEYEATFNAGRGVYNTIKISKDINHMQGELDSLRNENPSLRNLNDKDLIDVLNNYKEDLKSYYLDGYELMNSDYERMNDRLFGSRKGSNENSTGNIARTGATINGNTYTFDQIVDQLGYNNEAEFRENATPSISSYSPVAGKWIANAINSDGESVSMYIEPDNQLKSKSKLSQQAYSMMLEGKSFGKMGPDPADPNYQYYFINDFTSTDPIILRAPDNIESADDAVRRYESNPEGMKKFRFSKIKGMESSFILSDPLFKDMSGVKNKK